ncbi:MAG TPA: AmmeMemoRadiSam system protein B [Anaerolineaceae bacterium]|nr:AmmeMemoRadiSam system protein B [Anaerolineaceae bacterium]HPN52076.1 AmmeMemoRadiSam system protein B [Anaerolineaceae bacterium]
MDTITDIRPSPIAGRWYEGDPARLKAAVNQYINAAAVTALEGPVMGLVSPHAGHMYSGPVAGYAFKTVQGMAVDLLVVVSPLHHFAPQPLLTTAHQAYGTPLGTIPVDRAAVEQVDAILKDTASLRLTPVPRDGEHALEIELPFAQCALQPGFTLLPVMVRDQSSNTARALGHALARVVRGKTFLLVASTDLSHFFPQERAEWLDSAVLQQIGAFSPEGLYELESKGKGHACGLAAVAAVLWAARELGANHVRILRHATSGAVTGDESSVVGYGAAAIMQIP